VRIVVGSRTDIGRARERNEDAFLIRQPLFVVADGMGGHRGGDVASRLAVQALEELDPSAEDGAREISERVREANRRIMERSQADRAVRGMGTTLTAFLADGDRAHLAHVGDSRAYLLRDGALQQLSEDHRLVQRMVREGKLRPEEAETHPQRNILTRVLGVEEPLDVDILTLDLHPGDRLVLCSDGLSSMVDEEEMRSILERERDPQRACDELVQSANAHGGDDNITVIVLDIQQGDGSDAATTAAERSPATVGGSAAVAESAPPRTSEPGEEDRERPRRGRLRYALWGLLVVAIVLGSILGFRAYVDRQWYVGEQAGRVAIYNGIPSSVAGFRLSHVAELTDLSSARVERLPAYGDLRQGITTNIDNLQDAEGLVSQMRSDLRRTRSGP
jgi:serine/threonine protein phosphatase PrpC